jgi:hypothetical protein
MAGVILEARFKSILLALSDVLRPAGFKKNGKRFRRKHDGNFNIVEIQRSSSSNAESIKFTVNIGILQTRLATLYEIDAAKAGTADAHIRLRIGNFLPKHHDVWWTLNSGDPPEQAIQEISILLKQRVVPYLDQHSSDAALVTLWKIERNTGLTSAECQHYLSILPTVS